MSIRLDSTALRSWLQSRAQYVKQAVSIAVQQAGERAAENARLTPLFKDGKRAATRGTIKFRMAGSSGKLIARGASHFLEWGTKAHVISPKKGKMLRFAVAGNMVFARKVQHPGTRPRPFMRDAREVGARALYEFTVSRIKDALR
jgi:hypothetical protein